MLNHAWLSHAEAFQDFHRESTLFFPELIICKDYTETFVERSNSKEKAVRSTIKFLSTVQLSYLLFARHQHNIIGDEFQANNRTVGFREALPNKMMKFKFF